MKMGIFFGAPRKQTILYHPAVLTPYPTFLSGLDVLGGGQLPDAKTSQDTGATE